MSKVGVVTTLAFGLSAGVAAAQDPQCGPEDEMIQLLANEYGEVEIASFQTPNNNYRYMFFAHHISNDLTPRTWALLVTDPEQPNPDFQTCIAIGGETWVKIGQMTDETLPSGILADIERLYSQDGCISEHSFFAASGYWDETIQFAGESVDMQTGHPVRYVLSNIEDQAYLGVVSQQPDLTSMHPLALSPATNYCQIIEGVIDADDSWFELLNEEGAEIGQRFQLEN